MLKNKLKKETTTFQTSCTVEFFEMLEKYCEKTGTARSKLIVIALGKELAERGKNG